MQVIYEMVLFFSLIIGCVVLISQVTSITCFKDYVQQMISLLFHYGIPQLLNTTYNAPVFGRHRVHLYTEIKQLLNNHT